MGDSRVIWRFDLVSKTGRPSVVSMPRGAKILSLQVQDSKPVIWAVIDPDEFTFEDYRVAVLATGEQFIPKGLEGLAFVETFQWGNGTVWHLFADGRIVGCTKYMPLSVSPGLLEFMNQHTNVTGSGPEVPTPAPEDKDCGEKEKEKERGN